MRSLQSERTIQTSLMLLYPQQGTLQSPCSILQVPHLFTSFMKSKHGGQGRDGGMRASNELHALCYLPQLYTRVPPHDVILVHIMEYTFHGHQAGV